MAKAAVILLALLYVAIICLAIRAMKPYRPHRIEDYFFLNLLIIIASAFAIAIAFMAAAVFSS